MQLIRVSPINRLDKIKMPFPYYKFNKITSPGVPPSTPEDEPIVKKPPEKEPPDKLPPGIDPSIKEPNKNPEKKVALTLKGRRPPGFSARCFGKFNLT